MASVRSRIEHDIVGAAFHAALEQRLERLVRAVLPVEGKIVAEQHIAPRFSAQRGEKAGQGIHVFAMNFDQREVGLPPSAMAACTALIRELLPMPRAPQSRALLAGSPFAKRRVFREENVARAIDAP